MDTLKKSETKWLPDGFHFLGPTEAGERQQLTRKLSEHLLREGYSEVILPAMDYSASFLSNIHPEEVRSVLRFRDLNGQELSPGIDLTVQVVKGMAGLSHLTENQNVFYLSKRIRDHKKRNASRREILQLGAERLGSSSPETILKILTEVDDLLRMASPGTRPVLVLGNTLLLKAILDTLGWNEGSENGEEFRALIHTKNFSGIEKFSRDVRIPSSISSILPQLMNWMELSNAKDFLVKNASSILSPVDSNHLIQSLRIIQDGWNSRERYSEICIDLSLVRDLNYYTGFLFQGYIPGATEPVVTGGQYDHLFEIFSGEQRDSCGYAINLDGFV